jgi:hypothetical protein
MENEGLYGIADAVKENPLTVYPLFVRSIAGRPFRIVKDNPKLSNVLMKVGREPIDDPEQCKKSRKLGFDETNPHDRFWGIRKPNPQACIPDEQLTFILKRVLAS